MWLLVLFIILTVSVINIPLQRLKFNRAARQLCQIGLQCPECFAHRLIKERFYLYECLSCGALIDETNVPILEEKKAVTKFFNR